MTIIGFGFTSIVAQKRAVLKGNVSISNNVAIGGVSDAQLAVSEKKQSLRVTFGFESKYEPDMARIRLDGEVVLLEDAETAKQILDEWSKSKTIPKELMSAVLNHVLERCNVQALILARDLALPSPIPMPKVNAVPKASPTAQEKKTDEKKTKKK